MSCDPVTPIQQQTVWVNKRNETQLFLLLYISATSILYEYSYAEIMIFLVMVLVKNNGEI